MLTLKKKRNRTSSSKTDAKWIYNWIKNPEDYWPDTKMPNLSSFEKLVEKITSRDRPYPEINDIPN